MGVSHDNAQQIMDIDFGVAELSCETSIFHCDSNDDAGIVTLVIVTVTVMKTKNAWNEDASVSFFLVGGMVFLSTRRDKTMLLSEAVVSIEVEMKTNLGDRASSSIINESIFIISDFFLKDGSGNEAMIG